MVDIRIMSKQIKVGDKVKLGSTVGTVVGFEGFMFMDALVKFEESGNTSAVKVVSLKKTK